MSSSSHIQNTPMNVRELISHLMGVEDKEIPIVISDNWKSTEVYSISVDEKEVTLVISKLFK